MTTERDRQTDGQMDRTSGERERERERGREMKGPRRVNEGLKKKVT